ncbi:MAG: F0F1 ATP synthase subunit B [Ruminococcaceae bacterium]|nr:F0F1 ATP synthase subunit B [Oscillospiraceae bacterium]
MDTQGFVSIDIWTIIFTWINLVILSLILRKILLKPIKSILEQREQEVMELYGNAETAKQDAEQLRQQYQEKMAEAGKEASEILHTAEQMAQKKETAILTEAREKAGRLLRDGEEAARLEMEKQQQRNREQMADIAVLAAEQILQRELNEKDYESLVLKTIDELGDAS